MTVYTVNAEATAAGHPPLIVFMVTLRHLPPGSFVITAADHGPVSERVMAAGGIRPRRPP